MTTPPNLDIGTSWVYALVLFIATSAMAQCGNVQEADAQVRPGQDMRPEVVLARVCVKEASFDGFADCAPIASVLTRVGRGNVVLGARRYSPKTFDHTRLGRRPWIAYLNERGDEPMFWPANMNWSNHRANWLRMVELARSILVPPGPSSSAPCDPDHWGDKVRDHERAVHMRWLQIDCGRTRNEYWVVPRRRPRATVASVQQSGAPVLASLARGRNR